MTPNVWSGRIRLNVIHGTPKFRSGHASSAAAYMPSSMPTMPHAADASRNRRTTWSL